MYLQYSKQKLGRKEVEEGGIWCEEACFLLSP